MTFTTNQLISLCQQATFLTSASNISQAPNDDGFEIAFAGRSNAGKSSALNAITKHNLARTSKTPGRTQLINFFFLDHAHRLVDLPGYGFAKVPLALKHHWQKHLEMYLSQRASLKGLILLMDIRHPLSDFDKMILDWGKIAKLPIHVLLTKADKMAFGASKNTLLKIDQLITKSWGNNCTIQLFSSPKKKGLEEAYQFIQSCFKTSI